MPDQSIPGYRVGQHGWIDVLDSEGQRRRWVEGELLRLIPVGECTVWALIRTRLGTGVYRLW
jgi:hypothetical protein